MPRSEKPPISVLVVDDDPEVQAYLCSAVGSATLVEDRSTRVRAADDLAGAARQLAAEPTDLVVLDLDLPDSTGLGTVVEVAALTSAAVVVVTGSAGPGQVEQIVLAGAHDCMVKGEFDSRELLRTLRVNIARMRRVSETIGDLVLQRDALAEALAAENPPSDDAGSDDPGEREPGTPMVAGHEHGLRSASLGQISLADSFPDQVSALVAAYAELAVHRLEERGLHVDYQVATRSRKLSWDLGRLRARPRDLVEIHLAAIADLTAGKGPARRVAISRAGESLLVETMGHLATYYRTQQLGSTAASPRASDKRRQEMPS